jgi:beta-N-acetylhexosaminidase
MSLTASATAQAPDSAPAIHAASSEAPHAAARQLAGQLIMIRFPGPVLDAATAQFMRDNHIRACCLYRNNIESAEQVRQLTFDLRAVMGEQALIAIDQEGGAVVRATFLPAPPPALALGAVDDLALAQQVGRAVARGLKSLGINWNFAPVLDLNNNPANPIIAERSFGTDPARVAELASAWMAGSLAEGVACCVKHAPGHGDTHLDSHRDLPTVDKALADLQNLEFLPFQALAGQAPALMTAHIVYPALDATLPATLSHAILTDLVRGQWQFQGVVITDGMDMAAIASHFGVGPAAVLALLAGADMVMALGTPETQQQTIDALADCILQGQISPLALQARQDRLTYIARHYPATTVPYPPEQEQNDRALMQQAWQRALTGHGQPQPPRMGSRLRVVMRRDTSSDGVSEAGLDSAAVVRWLSNWYDVELTTYGAEQELIWASLPNDGRSVLLVSTSRARYGTHARQQFRPALHLCLWNPFHVLDIDAPAIVAYGSAAPALAALGAWLEGRVQAVGRNPCLSADVATDAPT